MLQVIFTHLLVENLSVLSPAVVALDAGPQVASLAVRVGGDGGAEPLAERDQVHVARPGGAVVAELGARRVAPVHEAKPGAGLALARARRARPGEDAPARQRRRVARGGAARDGAEAARVHVIRDRRILPEERLALIRVARHGGAANETGRGD